MDGEDEDGLGAGASDEGPMEDLDDIQVRLGAIAV